MRGVEIGAKGIKLSIIEVKIDKNGEHYYTLKMDSSINTDAAALSYQSEKETFDAITIFYNIIRDRYEIPSSKIHIVISSGLKQELDKYNKVEYFATIVRPKDLDPKIKINRKAFLKILSLLTLTGCDMNTKELNNILQSKSKSGKMPVIFVGHGNPMFAITPNPYRDVWAEIGKKMPTPNAILCISAHWLTKGTAVTMVHKPKTIHDFGGFPDELFKQQYPAAGSPEYAKLTIDTVKSTNVLEDYEWGLDHGTWSVLLNMFPKANIPVFQMSIDYYKSLQYHFDLGKELSALRAKGVLIIGSGNVVHNLRQFGG